jgi:hypothetical protein
MPAPIRPLRPVAEDRKEQEDSAEMLLLGNTVNVAAVVNVANARKEEEEAVAAEVPIAAAEVTVAEAREGKSKVKF